MVCYPNLKKWKKNDEQCCLDALPDRWKETIREARELYGHTVQSVAARSIVHKFLKRSPVWTKTERVLMGLIVRFTSSFNRLKIQFFKEVKTNRKSHPWKLSITIEKEYVPLLNFCCPRLRMWSSGYRR